MEQIYNHGMTFGHVAENLITVTRQSSLTGNVSTMEIPARQGQIEYWKQSGENIQDVLGWLNADQREFLMTGITPVEWESMMQSQISRLDHLL